MIVTEDEAKTKWCPEERAVFVPEADAARWLSGHNILITIEGDEINTTHRVKCIVTECIFWQWHAWRCGEGCGTTDAGKIKADKYEPCKPPQFPQYYDHIGHCGRANG